MPSFIVPKDSEAKTREGAHFECSEHSTIHLAYNFDLLPKQLSSNRLLWVCLIFVQCPSLVRSSHFMWPLEMNLHRICHEKNALLAWKQHRDHTKLRLEPLLLCLKAHIMSYSKLFLYLIISCSAKVILESDVSLLLNFPPDLIYYSRIWWEIHDHY